MQIEVPHNYMFLVLEINFLEKWPTEILDLKNDFT